MLLTINESGDKSMLFQHLSDSVDSLTESTAALARGLVPANPFLIMGQQSMTDPTCMPAGKETVWAYSHVPREISAATWAGTRPPRVTVCSIVPASSGSPTECSARSRSWRPASVRQLR